MIVSTKGGSIQLYRHSIFVVILFACLLSTLTSHSVTGQSVVLTSIATGLTRPVAIENAGDGSGRLFIVQQTGEILIWDGTQVLPTPFLDLSSKVECCGERGLLSLAFHPGYGTSSNFFYVYYTKKATFEVTIARYTVSGNPNIADPNSELVLKSIPHNLHPNHNGGSIHFHPINGFLYVSIGDGGGGGDPEANAQNLNALLGKILRLDVDAPSPYIPASNPFANDADPNTLGEIWSYGVRNPWRFTFDRSNGDMLIGDVGQNCWEEVDFRPANSSGGENFGWNVMEGNKCYDLAGGGSNCNLPPTCVIPGLTSPVIAYSHTLPNVQAVTGGYIYRGVDMPSFFGTYFFADYASGQIWNALPGGANWNFVEVASTGNLISSFGEDEGGELYYASLGFGTADGAVYKLSVPPSLPYSDDFSDNDASDWTAAKGTWTVTGGVLQGSSAKKASIYSPFQGCSICTIETDLQINTPGKISLLGWFRSKSEFVEVRLIEDTNRLVLLQRSGGTVSAKRKVNFVVDPGVNYHAKIVFDGTQFQLFMNGDTTPLITLPANGTPSGGVGFRIRAKGGATVTASFDQISVY